MEFRLLGPIEVRVDGRAVPVPGPRQRALLAALLLSANRPVTAERLVDAIWGEEPPASAAPNLRQHLTALRRRLGAESSRITGQPGSGYLIEVRPGELDLDVFTDLVDQAQRQGQPAALAELLGKALEVWRGEPLQGVPSHPAFAAAATRLGERRLATLEDWLEARLALGRHDDVLPELRAQVVEHPLRERMWGLLMRALYQADRQGDALGAYDQARRILADELGVAPGPALQELYERVIAADPLLSGPRAVRQAGSTPMQLPPAISHFTGRESALVRLDRLAVEASRDDAPTVVISAIDGGGGVGKTALAVHWAHKVRDRFPDGQLYVNLRGFDPGGTAMTPAEAVRSFLDAFGVPAERIPATLEARAGLYRSLLAGRRVLVVLDNARDAEQVRPLLPGAPGCLVVVTSRNQLSSLVAAEGAHPLPLDLLTVDEARDLLARRLGRRRVQAEPDAVTEIITRCARLPLALAVVAARAATHPHFQLTTLAAELRAAPSGLDAFDGGDATTQVRAVLSWSYHALGADAARLFRLLGLHPGPDLAPAAAASLAGLPPLQTRPLLAELTRAHLLTEHAPGRYACHDLLRAYATELACAHEPAPDRQAALHRVLDHYLHTAHAAALQLNPHRDPVTSAPPRPNVTLEELPALGPALAWLIAEHPVLLAILSQAADTGFDAHAWQLAWSIMEFLDRQGHWHDQVAIQALALEAARRVGDRLGQAHAHRNLGWAHTRLHQPDAAHAHFQNALDLYGALGDIRGRAHIHGNLSGVLERQGRYRDALVHARQAFDLYQAAGHRAGQARALNAVGWQHAQLGEHHTSLMHCTRALALHEQTGDRYGQAATWHSLGYAHHHLGQHARALACYRRAIALNRQAGDRHSEAETLTHLGEAQQASGDLDAARRTWQDAADILDELGHPDADHVRAKLRSAAGA